MTIPIDDGPTELSADERNWLSTDPCTSEPIWIGDTGDANAIDRLNDALNHALGGITPQFEIHGLRKLAKVRTDIYGNPMSVPLVYHEWKDENKQPKRQNWTLNALPFHIDRLRRTTPDNMVLIAELFMRYSKVHGQRRAERDESHQYFSVMQLKQVNENGLICDDNAERDPNVLLLVEKVSKLVIPLPTHSMLYWRVFYDGNGIELGVYDGIALQRRMERYPMYYLPGVNLPENAIEQDIKSCLRTLEALKDSACNPRGLKRKQLPKPPFSEEDMQEYRRKMREYLRQIPNSLPENM